MVEESALFEEGANGGEIVPAELFAIAQGQFESGAFQMRQEDFQVLGIDIDRKSTRLNSSH